MPWAFQTDFSDRQVVDSVTHCVFVQETVVFPNVRRRGTVEGVAFGRAAVVGRLPGTAPVEGWQVTDMQDR